MKMRWIHFMLVALGIHSILAEEYETNEISTHSKTNLDGNLRRALLKALTELENDDKGNPDNQFADGVKEKIIEKASASSVSIFADSQSEQSSPSSIATTAGTTTENSLVFFQKSEGVQHPSIVTVERDDEDSEQILTSASNRFTNQPYQNSIQEDKVEISSPSTNKGTTKLKRVEPTTIAPTVSTEESDAQVEDVQFFSAPLVAAFTVHQDELGQPNKVEAIYKANLPKSAQVNTVEQERITLAEREQIRQLQLEQERLKLEELRRQQLKFQQYQQELKQKSLEQEIFRLNLSLKQQEQIHLRQQEELRTRANVQSFPVGNSGFRNNGFLVNQQPPFRSPHQFNTGSVFVQPSLTFDPLLEAGKLPVNAQVLPVRGPIDFQSPFVTFPLNNFQQDPNNRFFRQTTGTGNFGVNDQKNSFSIQQSVQPSFDNSAQRNRFFRSNGESTLTSPQFIQPPQPLNNRFFRSNLESTFGSPSNNFYNPQGSNNHQLSNLLHNYGAFRGKSPEDLNLISKVLSLNHVGSNSGNSVRQNQRPYSTIF